MTSLTVNRPMDIAFVPFTFPTAMFSSLAGDLGYNFTYGQIDDLYSAYKDGRESGELSQMGNTSEAAAYMASYTGLSRGKAAQWLDTADEAAKKSWGAGSYFKDFGAPGVFESLPSDLTGVVSGTVKIVSETAGKAVAAVGAGLSKGLGIPKWILWSVIGLIAVGVLYFLAKSYLPKKTGLLSKLRSA